MVKMVVLGTAQDGGVPQLGCRQPYCERARREPAFARRVACLGLIDEEAQKAFLVDATPDVRTQLDELSELIRWTRATRNPVDGLILTHAHVGHYTGLIQFGKEVMATKQLPTYASAFMIGYLIQNGPWAELVRDEHLAMRALDDGTSVNLSANLSIKPLLVPHRDEWSDTLGLEISGPVRRALYVPDIDRWSDWALDLSEVVAQCDLALLDGCFYSGDELPGRDISKVPHPLISDTMARLSGQAEKVHFTHLNHTNPAIDPESPERREIEARGFHVTGEGQVFEL